MNKFGDIQLQHTSLDSNCDREEPQTSIKAVLQVTDDDDKDIKESGVIIPMRASNSWKKRLVLASLAVPLVCGLNQITPALSQDVEPPETNNTEKTAPVNLTVTEPSTTISSEMEDLLKKSEAKPSELKALSTDDIVKAVTLIASENVWPEGQRDRAEKTLAVLYDAQSAQLSPALITETKRLASSTIKNAFRSTAMQKIYRKARGGSEIQEQELEEFLQSYKQLLERVFGLPSGPLEIVNTEEPFDMRYLIDKDLIEVNLGEGSSCNGQGPKKAKDEYNRRSLWLSCLFFAELHEMIHRWVVLEIAKPNPFNGQFKPDVALFTANLHNIDYENPRNRGAYLLGDQSDTGTKLNRLNPLEAHIVLGMFPYVTKLAKELEVNPSSIPEVFIPKGTRNLPGLAKYRKKQRKN